MKASIVIPFYNNEDTLRETIISALSQTYLGREVILVNDGSIDRSREIASQYTDWITILDQQNSGVAKARNLGLLACDGDVIIPLDADDIIDPFYLERTIPLMVDGVGIVSTDMQRFGDQTERIAPELSTPNHNGLPVTSLIRKKAIFEIGGYDPSVMYEDWDCYLRILKNGWKAVFLNEPLFRYRVRGGGRNAMQDQNKLKYEMEIWERHA